MRTLIWKEVHENLKWAALALVLVGGIVALQGPPALMHYTFLLGLNLLSAGCAAGLGFLQVFFESRGDQRALLLHRPVSRSRIFLAKAIAGLGLYLLAMGIPFACAVTWTAIPGHVAAPFTWSMALPWLADIFTGVVYYFAGMLTAQREARWYGSRGLGLAAAVLCSFLVWGLPEFWHALVVIGLTALMVGLTAWGHFLSGGANVPQPRLARVALMGTFLAGLLFLSVVGKVVIGAWFDSGAKMVYTLHRDGRMLVVHAQGGKSPRLTDLEGRELPEVQGKELDSSAIRGIEVSLSRPAWPSFRTYRNPGRFSVRYRNDTSSGAEAWFYVPDQGRVLGYDRDSRRFIGSFGPEGFAGPDQQPSDRFEGVPTHPNGPFEVGPAAFLDFGGGAQAVDFARRTIRTILVPPEGETLLWAVPWWDEKHKRVLAVVSTDRSIHVVDDKGASVFSAPLAFDAESHGIVRFGRLDNPPRFVLWYQPSVQMGLAARKQSPHQVVEFDAAGREIARRTEPPEPLVESADAQALFGLVTPPAEALILTAATSNPCSGPDPRKGWEARTLPYILILSSHYFIPGNGWLVTARGSLVWTFRSLILLQAVVCALLCLLLARRFVFSRARCLGWSLIGLLFGPTGLLLMLAVEEWPARLVCPKCRKLRVVSRDQCEHCGAAHTQPAPDGSEIFEHPDCHRTPAGVTS
jgi:hypothetical protein